MHGSARLGVPAITLLLLSGTALGARAQDDATTNPSAGPRVIGIGIPVFGPDGALYSTDCGAGVVVRLEGPTTARIVAGDWHGDDPFAPGSSPFGDGGPATSAQLVCPIDALFDPQGRLLVVDHGHNRIRRIDADGTIETIVGAGSPPVSNGGDFAGDGGPAVDAHLNSPEFLAFDAAGDLYISDRDNDRVRKVAPDGAITTFAGNGDPTFGGDGGPAVDAGIDYPLQIAVAPSGDVYIADDNHNRIRRVSSTGIISTVIGDGSFGSAGDGGPASDAQVNDPQGVVLDASGNLYVSEYGGNRIRRIDPSGIVTTIAGTGIDGLEGMDGPAVDAQIPQPGALAIGPDGALYVDDEEYPRILRIDLETGIVTVAAGGLDGVIVP
jgi:sugar lactone lactonase YvrE